MDKHNNTRKRLKTGSEAVTNKTSASQNIKANKNWTADWYNQNAKLKATPVVVLLAKTPGLILKWWEN